ncbi:unnamed protein product [Eruca vesicaria subsp. sativa]|uniref:Uncharacterized protein n=1 Tax=Eruca vesicaria subsp. sativa TaxID=29727 RepID=A0ABC8KTX5_ERUVS|nr:unnamed protein product [Eruca vesicaria subsp. sativa]
MELLSWIRNLWIRTIKQNGLDQSKEFKGNFCCLRAQVSSEVEDIRTNSFAFNEPSHHMKLPEAAEEEEIWLDHEDVFGGFLTIRTLDIDPETPRFTSVAEEDVTGAQKDIAKLLSEKLDKVLEEYEDSRSSKLVERSNAGVVDVCPSQGYDLIEFTKRSKEVRKKKALLKSLFKRRKIVEGECNTLEKHGTEDLIKSLFEKLHKSSSKTRKDDYMHKKKDIRKNVQIFRRKVHPVLCAPARDDNEMDDTNGSNLKTQPPFSSSILEASRKREKWIKTDAECKSRSYTKTLKPIRFFICL